jgi:disulfide bond formation protein DsbB
MNGPRALSAAHLLALGVPAALLAGAYIGQYGFDLYPCDMCWWQRYPHFAALVLALAGFVAQPRRVFVLLAGVAILSSGLIGAFHAGVEYGWWEGLTSCSVSNRGGNPLDAIYNNFTLVRCDEVQWELFGISLAGFNFLISTIGALTIFALVRRSRA